MKIEPTEGRIIDDREKGIFRVNRSVFTEAAILQTERDRIFNRSWLYVGHESEVAKIGDFIARTVAGRPIILTRDGKGTPRVYSNSCSHRGNLVTRETSGNTKSFSCFYHAWSFNLDGELVGLPGTDAYSPDFRRGEMGLRSPQKVDSYRGLIFISFDPDIVPLVEYLGAAREHIDYMMDFGGDEVEVAPGQQAYCMKANWKLLVENSMDSYHAMPTHGRFFRQYLPDIGIDSKIWLQGNADLPPSRGIALGNGHAVTVKPLRVTPIVARAGDELARIRQGLVDKFGEARASLIADYTRNLFIFPNLVMIADWRTLRTFYPVSPDYMEINAWALLPKNESPELRQIRYENFISFLGPAGFGTPDDVSGLEGCQRGFAAEGADAVWSDISRGMKREVPFSDDELQMRGFWRRWHALMNGADGPTDCSDQPAGAASAGRAA